jgi:S-(hydroxymethyl)glutathione dehydrogenase/alcohol dehydrogenase
MKTKAAVVRETGNLTIEEIELDPPKAGEVLVRMRAAGVCHSDLHTFRGELRTVPPLVLGHEGAGIVEGVGSAVTSVKPGNPILVNWLPACESCPNCLNGNFTLCERFSDTTYQGMLLDGTSRLKTLDGVQLKHYLGAATMSEYIVIDAASAIRIPGDVPFEVAAIMGCAVATGVGAVTNAARVPAGSSAAVIGCGGIGLSMIQGCKLAGCHPIVAVDVLDSKLAFARRMGATETVNARQLDVIAALRELTYNGPDYIFDSVGSATTITQALCAARPGGTAVIVGLQAATIDIPLSPGNLVFESKHLLGSFAGSGHPRTDLPRLVELYRTGRLQLDDLITKRYPLQDLPQAFADMESGAVARGVITFEH